MKKLKIELKGWDYTCGDGCCTDYGTELVLNGKTLDHPDSTDDEYMNGAYVGDSVYLSLKAVLQELGYEVEIIER